MGEPDLAAVAAANEAWVLEPEGSEVVETAEYRLVRFPERFPDPLQVQWVRSARPAEAVLADVIARAVEFGLPEAGVYVRLSAPDGLDEALLGRGAQLVDTGDVLAMALPANVKTPDLPGLEERWRTTPEVSRDANTIGISIFGGSRAGDDELARVAAANRDTVAAGTGGAMVAYLGGTPVAIAGVEVVDGVARLWGGAVLEAYRGRGAYRALVAARLTYAAEHGAAMALTQGRIATSSPILQRLGFVSYGQERSYRLPLG
jgi:hypothetical protein